jgi:hypothetical protein
MRIILLNWTFNISGVVDFVRLLDLASVHAWGCLVELVVVILVLGVQAHSLTEFLLFKPYFTLDHL